MTTAPVVTITDEIIAELEQLSDMATPGPWHYAKHDDCQYVAGPCDEFVCTDGDHVHDIQFIVATNPKIIRALLAERASLLADARRYRWIRNNPNVKKGFGPFFDPSDCWTYLDQTIDSAIKSGLDS